MMQAVTATIIPTYAGAQRFIAGASVKIKNQDSREVGDKKPPIYSAPSAYVLCHPLTTDLPRYLLHSPPTLWSTPRNGAVRPAQYQPG